MAQISTQFDSNTRSSDRRAHLRQPVRSLAYVELGDGNGGIVLNISEVGMAVQAVMSLGGNEIPVMRLQLAHSKKQIEAKGQVAWTDQFRKLAGIEFVDLSEEARAQIRDWILVESPVLESSGAPESSVAKSANATVSKSAEAAKPASEPSASSEQLQMNETSREPAPSKISPSAAPPTRARIPVAPAAEVPPAFVPAPFAPDPEFPPPCARHSLRRPFRRLEPRRVPRPKPERKPKSTGTKLRHRLLPPRLPFALHPPQRRLQECCIARRIFRPIALDSGASSHHGLC